MKTKWFAKESLEFGELAHWEQIEVHTMQFIEGDRVVVEPFGLEATVRTFLKDMSDEYGENHYVVEYDDRQVATYDEYRAEWVHRGMVVRESHLTEAPEREDFIALNSSERGVVTGILMELLDDGEWRITDNDDGSRYPLKVEVVEGVLDE